MADFWGCCLYAKPSRSYDERRQFGLAGSSRRRVLVEGVSNNIRVSAQKMRRLVYAHTPFYVVSAIIDQTLSAKFTSGDHKYEYHLI